MGTMIEIMETACLGLRPVEDDDCPGDVNLFRSEALGERPALTVQVGDEFVGEWVGESYAIYLRRRGCRLPYYGRGRAVCACSRGDSQMVRSSVGTCQPSCSARARPASSPGMISATNKITSRRSVAANAVRCRRMILSTPAHEPASMHVRMSSTASSRRLSSFVDLVCFEVIFGGAPGTAICNFVSPQARNAAFGHPLTRLARPLQHSFQAVPPRRRWLRFRHPPWRRGSGVEFDGKRVGGGLYGAVGDRPASDVSAG